MKNSSHSTIESQSDNKNYRFQQYQKKMIQLNQREKRKRPCKSIKNCIQMDIQEPLNIKNFSQQIKVYVPNIVNYLASQEINSMILQNYMKWQTDIDSKMREILIGWMIEVATGHNLKPETLQLACLLVDKFCYSRNILTRKYQVLGGACLFIAAKYQQLKTPNLKRYVDISAGQYNQYDLLKMESQILVTLNFNLNQRTTLTLFDLKVKQYQASQNILNFGHFLLQMCLIEFQFCRLKPTYLSLAVFYFTMKIKRKRISKFKIFVEENSLDEQSFFTYLKYIEKLYNIRNLPKFQSLKKRHSQLFDQEFELK